MKILYLCTDNGIDLAGRTGAATHVRAFVRALVELGHQVSVVCSTLNGQKNLEAELPAMIHPAPLAPWNRLLSRLIGAGNRLLGRKPRRYPDAVRALHNFAFYLAAAEAASQFDPDFIYERYSLWGVAGVRLARIRSILHVLEVNAPLAYEQQRRAGLTCPNLAGRVERTLWRKANLVFAVSESLRSQVIDAGALPAHVHLLPNGVDPRLFRRDVDGQMVRNRFGLERRFVVGFSGNFRAWHGLDLLIEAFQELHRTEPSTRLLLVGDGRLRPQLEEQVSRTGLEAAVTFAGSVPYEQMPYYLAAMDVAVAPYPALEQFYFSPLKLFEYMASGRAVVASRIGQIAEVVKDGVTGLLYEPGDRAELVNCLRRLLKDAALREQMGRSATAASSQNTWIQNAAKVIRLADALVEKRSAS